MKFIQTLSLNKDPFKNGFGWIAPEYHLMSWALSSLQLHKIYKKVDLYVNSCAAKLLLDCLQLPYYKVNITHDKLKIIHEGLWALPKIFTYSLQDEPFLHFDGDVFLFNQLPDSLLRNELIAQNIEEATDYYKSTQKQLTENFTYLPDCVKAEFACSVPIRAVNAGILGGKNISFIKEYTGVAFEYINRNATSLLSINVDRFNIFFEQHLFYSLAKEKNIPIGVLLSDVIKDNEYKYLGDIHETPCCRSYLHFLGHLKKDEYSCQQMATKLRELFPEYYYKIISLFKKNNAPLSQSFFYKRNLLNVNDFLSFNKEAKMIYRNEVPGVASDDNEVGEKEDISKLPDLILLKEIINSQSCSVNITSNNDSLERDLEIFSKNLYACKKVSSSWLYGRDLDSVNWYCTIFGDDSTLLNKTVSKCDEINIVESEYDWSGLLNKYKRVGIKYYKELELWPGHFFNLVIPEASKNGFSLFDLDELEKLILDHLSIPLSINELLIEMQCYAEEDVIECHLEIFNNLIIKMIKQLVVKKAIKPFKNII